MTTIEKCFELVEMNNFLKSGIASKGWGSVRSIVFKKMIFISFPVYNQKKILCAAFHNFFNEKASEHKVWI